MSQDKGGADTTSPDIVGLVSRRGMLGGLALTLAAVEVSAKTEVSFVETVEKLRAGFQEQRGGTWIATISSDFVLISQRTG